MISADRFIVQSRYHDEWIAARKLGVTATAVSLAATPSGFEQVASERLGLTTRFETSEMRFGTDAENEIARYAHHEFGILPSDWLIAGENPLHMGTPDGLALDHTMTAEIKTGGTIPKSVSRQYRDQDQWNLWVTGAEKCAHLFNLRVPDGNGGFRLGLWEPIVFWVERDDKRIAELCEVAERLMEVTDDY